MIILIPLLYIAIGLSIFAAIHHFMIAQRGIEVRMHYYFAIANFILPIYILSSIALYNSATVEEYIFAARIQSFCVPLFFVFFTRFTLFYLGRKISRLLEVLLYCYLLIPVIRLFSPTLFTYDKIIGIKQFYTPWGESLAQLDTTITTFGYIYYLSAFAIMSYNITLTFLTLKATRKRKYLVFFATQLIFLMAAINDIFLDAFNLNWFYIGEFGFVAMMLGIGVYISGSIYNSSLLRKKLIESERLLTGIIENSPLIIYIKDAEGRYILTNPEFDNHFISNDIQVLGKTDYEIFDKAVADSIRINDNLVKNSKQSVQQEEVIPINGKSHYFTSNRFLIYEESGELYAIAGIAADITNKKLLERRLRQSEKMQAIGQLAGGGGA